jgi:hypothetical protein
VKVGDLAMVETLKRDGKHKSFCSPIVEVCLPEDQVNGMYLIKVIEKGTGKWYPVGYIKVICEAR